MNEIRHQARGSSPAQITDLMRGRLLLTPVTVALVGMNLCVFAAMLVHGGGIWHSPNDVQLGWGANFGPATKSGEWWRLGTAIFLHFGLIHLAVNMWALWDSGRLTERLYGSARFALIYFASGLTGNLLSLIVQADRAISGGASGAIFGVYGALLVWLWRERRHVHAVDFRWLFWGAAVFAFATIGFGFLIPGIDNAAHLGGLLAGALIGLALARRPSPDGGKAAYGRWFAAAAYLITVVGMVAAIPQPAYRWHEELQARAEVRQFLGTDERLSGRWSEILDAGHRGGATFAELADRVDSELTVEYQQSFEQLSALDLDQAAPSSGTVEALKKYTQIRGDASHMLAEGLRTHDKKLIREALELAREAPYLARGAKAPTNAAP